MVGEAGIVAELGGEFVMAKQVFRTRIKARLLAHRAVRAIIDPSNRDGVEVPIGTSRGHALFPDSGVISTRW